MRTTRAEEKTKEASPFIPTKQLAHTFVAIHTMGLVLGLLGVFLLPKGSSLWKAALVMSYVCGLPVIVSAGLYVLRKAGIWNGK